MAVPVWVPGQVLTASDVNNWLVPQGAVKPSSQSVVSSTAVVSDIDLVLPVAASAQYLMECVIGFTATSGGDFKWTWQVPSGASMLYQATHNEGGGVGLTQSTVIYSDANTITAAGAGATVEAVLMKGELNVAGTGGNLQLRWAQNVSNAGATTIRSQSYLALTRIG